MREDTVDLPTPSGRLASVDGVITAAEEAMVPVVDEGLIRGDGVFEVMRLFDGRPFAAEEHFARLERSARNLRLPLDLEAVRAEMYRLLAEAGARPGHGQLRVMVTRGGRRIILTEPLHRLPELARVATVTYAPTRILDGVKSLSYAPNMLATRLAVERGFDEALLVTPHGRVLEAPTKSFFWVRDGRLFTPPLADHILASITRAFILEVTDAEERPTTLDDVREADEVFLASTTREVQPVVAVDEWTYPGDGPVSARTAEAMEAYVRARMA